MASPEFQLIQRHFHWPHGRQDISIDSGDDAAALQLKVGHELLVSSDTLISGVHFPETTSAEDIGYKALAVNLSDVAAMGGEPAWITLALTLPSVNDAWLSDFTRGFSDLATQHDVALVGGDTTRGSLAMTVTILGQVPAGQALTRAAAQPGDDLWVSGYIGDATLGLLHHAQAHNPWLSRLNRPQARVGLGLALRSLATACIDVSDGLLADLQHLLHASGVGATVSLPSLFWSEHTQNWLQQGGDVMRLLSGGDDYELLFTAPPKQRGAIEALDCAVPLTRIGRIGSVDDGLRVVDEQQQALSLSQAGYDHFESARG